MQEDAKEISAERSEYNKGLGEEKSSSADGSKTKQIETVKPNKESKRPLDMIEQTWVLQRQQYVLQELGFDIKERKKEDSEKKKTYLASEMVEASWIPIINDMNKGKQIWDMMVLALAIVTSFAVGFELVLKSLSENEHYANLTTATNYINEVSIRNQFKSISN